MIGTICFIADFDTENTLNDFKVEASENFHVGVRGGNAPRHISLGMPYDVPDWKAYITYAEELAKTLHPVTVQAEDMGAVPFPTPETGLFYLKFKEDFGLDNIRTNLKKDIKEQLDITIEDNLVGKRVIALGCGTASLDAYKAYVASVDKKRYQGLKLRFDQIGVFYYPERNWDPSTYICYRRIRLQ